MTSYTVTAPRLNGRRKPDLTADVGTVRNQGDTITGEQNGDWVEADDDLYYKAEFLAEDLQGEPVDQDAELPSGVDTVTNTGPGPEPVEAKHATDEENTDD